MSSEHDDGPIHQAPWVVPVTVAMCLGFVLLMMLIRFFFAAELGASI